MRCGDAARTHFPPTLAGRSGAGWRRGAGSGHQRGAQGPGPGHALGWSSPLPSPHWSPTRPGPRSLLITSAPTTASGGRFGEQKAANLRVSTLVTRVPRNSWFWKNRQTWGAGRRRREAPRPHHMLHENSRAQHKPHARQDAHRTPRATWGAEAGDPLLPRSPLPDVFRGCGFRLQDGPFNPHSGLPCVSHPRAAPTGPGNARAPRTGPCTQAPAPSATRGEGYLGDHVLAGHEQGPQQVLAAVTPEGVDGHLGGGRGSR